MRRVRERNPTGSAGFGRRPPVIGDRGPIDRAMAPTVPFREVTVQYSTSKLHLPLT